MDDVFYMSLLKCNIRKKEQVIQFPELELDLNAWEDKEYKIVVIKDSSIYLG